MRITAIVENGTIKLPVHVPNGTAVEITVPEQQPQKSGQPGVGRDLIIWMSDDFADPLPDEIWKHNEE